MYRPTWVAGLQEGYRLAVTSGVTHAALHAGRTGLPLPGNQGITRQKVFGLHFPGPGHSCPLRRRMRPFGGCWARYGVGSPHGKLTKATPSRKTGEWPEGDIGGSVPYDVLDGNGGQRRPPFPSRTVSRRGVRRLAARRGWLWHHLHPPAWAFLDVRVIRPSVLAVVPVGLLRRRGPLLDVLRGRRLDHHGLAAVVVGVGRAPPPSRVSPPPWAAPPASAPPMKTRVPPCHPPFHPGAPPCHPPPPADLAPPPPPPGPPAATSAGTAEPTKSSPISTSAHMICFMANPPLPCPSSGLGSTIPCGPADGGNPLRRPRPSRSWSRAHPLGQ